MRHAVINLRFLELLAYLMEVAFCLGFKFPVSGLRFPASALF